MATRSRSVWSGCSVEPATRGEGLRGWLALAARVAGGRCLGVVPTSIPVPVPRRLARGLRASPDRAAGHRRAWARARAHGLDDVPSFWPRLWPRTRCSISSPEPSVERLFLGPPWATFAADFLRKLPLNTPTMFKIRAPRAPRGHRAGTARSTRRKEQDRIAGESRPLRPGSAGGSGNFYTGSIIAIARQRP